MPRDLSYAGVQEDRYCEYLNDRKMRIMRLTEAEEIEDNSKEKIVRFVENARNTH